MEGGDMMTSMNKTIYINDVALSDFNIYCFSDTFLNGPSIDYTSYDIPSRIGSMVQYNKRFNNVERVFSCICSKETYVESLNSLKNILYKNVGYVKIASDYEPNMYQFGYLVDEIEVKPHITENTITFELRFSCNPKKYNINKITKNIYNRGLNIYTKSNDEFFIEIRERYKTYNEDIPCAFRHPVILRETSQKIRIDSVTTPTSEDSVIYSIIYVAFDTTMSQLIETRRVEIGDEFECHQNASNYLYYFTNWQTTTPNVNVRYSDYDGSQWQSHSTLFEIKDRTVEINEYMFNDVRLNFKIKFDTSRDVRNEESGLIYFDNGGEFVLNIAQINSLKSSFDEIKGYLTQVDETEYEGNLTVDFEARESYITAPNGARFSFNNYIQMNGLFYDANKFICGLGTYSTNFVYLGAQFIETIIEGWTL